MSDQAQYRFLPWTRRGLAGAIAAPDGGGALPARAAISVGVTVTNAGTNGVNLALYGPGDVLGVDSRLIVRVAPRAGSSNVETNYFAAIEFDPPDFPWMFTPASTDTNQRLRPWLVLVVLDRARVKPPAAERLRPLPVVSIRAEVAAQELPDLSESWAWAHTQVVTEQGNVTPLPDELRAEPDLNVSRLVCPRRLEPNHSYIACLVPAFDAGVTRGLGGAPDPKTPLGPAWTTPAGAVDLPVYYHWEFATGPLGDFESLARKLKPFACPDSVGVSPMYIGDGNPVIAPLAPDDAAATTLMDGALRAPKRGSGTLDEIAATIQDGLTSALNAPSAIMAGHPADATPVLGPPIYGQWHARQHTIDPNAPPWLRELNLDPRTRVAAGLGAEVVRQNQETFMQQAWEQVGEILKAGDRLNWGRLSLEAGLRLFVRHFQALPADRLLQIAAPLHGRTKAANATLLTELRASSLPNAAADPALRRLTSPQRPMLKATVRRLTASARLAPSYAASGRSQLVPELASGKRSVDPTRFMPDGLVGSLTLDAAAPGATLDLSSRGLALQVDAGRIASYQGNAAAFKGRDFQAAPLTVTPRADLRTSGLVTRSQIANLSALVVATNAATDLQTMIGAVRQTAAQSPGSKGLLVTQAAGKTLTVDPLEIDASGTILVHGQGGRLTPIGKVGAEVIAAGAANVSRVLSDLPLGALSGSGAVKPTIGTGAAGEIQIRGSALTTPTAPVGTVGSLRSPGSLRATIPVGPTATLGPALTTPSTRTPVVTPTPPIAIGPVTRPPVVVGPVITPTPPVVIGPVTPPVVIGPVLQLPPLTLPVQPAPPLPTNTVAMPITTAAVVAQYSATFSDLIAAQGLGSAVPADRFVSFGVADAAQTLLARLNPAVTVPRRMLELVKVEGRAINAVADLGLVVTPLLDRIMAAPDLPAPTYRYLAKYDQERFVPGIGVIPPNSITLLETNPRFIESFLVGLNYEMNRELLWRAYPTDQRGTPLRLFWQWLDGGADIPPIHTWRRTSALSSHTRGAGVGGQLVLLVRGELIRRYPNAVLLAWKATPDGSKMTGDPKDLKQPVFQGKLEPDISFAGFDLVDEDLTKAGGWFFVVQEQPTEPRFGFDQPQGAGQPGALSRWSDASWAHTGVAEGGFLHFGGSPLLGRTLGGLTFGSNAAHLASITLQQPMRIAVHGRYLVTA